MHTGPGIWPVLKIVALYAGAVIGAGFASGQEILQFFIVFGSEGLAGVALAGALFSYLGGVVMFLAVRAGSSNYKDIYRIIMGRTPARIMDVLNLVMMPGGIVVMLAGGGAVFSEHLGLPAFAGTLLTAVITAAAISRGMQGVVTVNAVLVPLKIVALLLICLGVLALARGNGFYPPAAGESIDTRVNWAWSSILYVSYNMVVPVAVLSSLGRTVTLPQGVAGGVLGGFTLGVVAALVVTAGLSLYPGITFYEVPVMYMAGTLGQTFKTAMGPLIWLAILTTAIADTHGFASRFAECNSKRYRVIGALTVLAALPLASFKFSMLVKVLYPLFGYAGLFLMLGLLFMPPVAFLGRKLFKSV